jgi:uncharacterized protein DUF2809
MRVHNNFLRVIYLILVIFFIWLALATRQHPQWFHPLVAQYGGDAIWAGMFLLLLRVFFLKIRLWKLALFAYTLGVITECLQLWHVSWIEAIRSTRLGGLIIGYGFLWSDIVCYAAGILLACILILLLERFFLSRRTT